MTEKVLSGNGECPSVTAVWGLVRELGEEAEGTFFLSLGGTSKNWDRSLRPKAGAVT